MAPMTSDRPGRSEASEPLVLNDAPMKRLMSLSGIWSMAAPSSRSFSGSRMTMDSPNLFQPALSRCVDKTCPDSGDMRKVSGLP